MACSDDPLPPPLLRPGSPRVSLHPRHPGAADPATVLQTAAAAHAVEAGLPDPRAGRPPQPRGATGGVAPPSLPPGAAQPGVRLPGGRGPRAAASARLAAPAAVRRPGLRVGHLALPPAVRHLPAQLPLLHGPPGRRR